MEDGPTRARFWREWGCPLPQQNATAHARRRTEVSQARSIAAFDRLCRAFLAKAILRSRYSKLWRVGPFSEGSIPGFVFDRNRNYRRCAPSRAREGGPPDGQKDRGRLNPVSPQSGEWGAVPDGDESQVCNAQKCRRRDRATCDARASLNLNSAFGFSKTPRGRGILAPSVYTAPSLRNQVLP